MTIDEEKSVEILSLLSDYLEEKKNAVIWTFSHRHEPMKSSKYYLMMPKGIPFFILRKRNIVSFFNNYFSPGIFHEKDFQRSPLPKVSIECYPCSTYPLFFFLGYCFSWFSRLFGPWKEVIGMARN